MAEKPAEGRQIYYLIKCRGEDGEDYWFRHGDSRYFTVRRLATLFLPHEALDELQIAKAQYSTRKIRLVEVEIKKRTFKRTRDELHRDCEQVASDLIVAAERYKASANAETQWKLIRASEDFSRFWREWKTVRS